MEIKIATSPAELEVIYRFRYAIYIQGMGKPIAGADHKQRILCDALDAHSTQLYVERCGEIAGVLRVTFGRDCIPDSFVNWYGLDRFRKFSASDISFNGRMMVAEKFRNSPMAYSLVRKSYEIGRENRIAFNFCHTTPPLFSFFERLGCRHYKDDFIDPDLGCRTPMVLILEDLAHLERCSSPFVKIAKQCQNNPDAAAWFNHEFEKQFPKNETNLTKPK